MAKSDIVFGSEFSPAVIDSFIDLLELVHQKQPDRFALQKAIDERFFPGKGANADPDKTLGDNTILAMIAYRILDRLDKATVRLSEFGEELYEARHEEAKLKELMGRQCLTQLNGLRVISSIQDLDQAGIPLKKDSISKRLREEGLHVPTNGKHLNILRQWLEFAGVLNPSKATGGSAMWMPDEARMKELIGVTSADVQQWGDLTKPQYDFARAFALMGADSATSSAVRDSAIALYSTDFPEGGLPQSVLHRLEEVGLIRAEKTTTGRGAKAHNVYATDKLKNEFLDPILEQLAHSMGRGYRKLARMPISEIIQDVACDDTHRKGIALEALAFSVCRGLDLAFLQWGLRSCATAGAVVDIVAEGSRLKFSRWQIRCVDRPRVLASDVAAQVGFALAEKARVIVLIGTRDVDHTARHFASVVMSSQPMRIIILGRRQLHEIKAGICSFAELIQSHDGSVLTRAA